MRIGKVWGLGDKKPKRYGVWVTKVWGLGDKAQTVKQRYRITIRI